MPAPLKNPKSVPPMTIFDRLPRLTPWRAGLWLTAFSTLLHAVAAGRVGLSTDEAHYALYGLNPDWSYFDHPPLVGWLQAVALWFGDGEFALRVIPMALFVATSLSLYALARRLFPEDSPWTGFTAVAIYQSGILFQLLGLALVPESALLLFGLLAMLALLRALDSGRLRDWLMVGLCFGLAGLSKYTAVTLVASATIYLLWQQRLAVLRTPGPWLAALLALLLITPVLYWNIQHDWISFSYQLDHGFKPQPWHLARAALSQAGQFLAYSPALYVLGLIALVAGLREHRHPGVRLTLALVLPLFVLFASGSGREETLPHWTALAWAGLAPLSARYLLRHGHSLGMRLLAGFGVLYSVVLVALLHSLIIHPWLSFPPGRHPLQSLYGWQQAAQHALALRDQMAATPGPAPVLLVNNWSLASRLAWYARPAPVQIPDRRFDQFDLWYGAPQPGARGIMVVPAYAKPPQSGGPGQFARCAALAPLPILRGGAEVVRYAFYACEAYQPDRR